MKKLLALTAAATALFAGRVFAADNQDTKYLTVDPDSAMITQITDRGGTIPLNPGTTPSSPGSIPLPKPPSGPQINPPVTGDPSSDFNNGLNQVNGTVAAIDAIVNLADKIWGIIEKNQPVVNITTNYANAVPYGTSHWSQLQGWTKPEVKKYSFSMNNLYGAEVVKVDYQVHYTYNGNFQGKGKFLTGVTIEPINVVTAWGYKVSLVSEVPDSTIANVGTHEDPIAAMQLQLRWTVHTAVKDISSKAIYYVRGDGIMQEIGSPFDRAAQIRNEAKTEGSTEKAANSRFN